jgi:asparagine synthase (glutamine-hydrolysing)
MPGIIGIISKQTNYNYENELNIMLKSMKYESFYESTFIIEKELNIYLGYVYDKYISINYIPIWNEEKNICLIFIGEDFRDQTEIDYIKSKGHNFESGDISYLVHFYEEIGIKFVEKINGWFHGLILDFRFKKIYLFNDRYGMQRVFIHENKNGFYFSSEAKALIRVLPETRQFNLEGLGEFFTYGCTLGNKTLYKNINILPPASLWIFENGIIKKKSYYFTPKEWISKKCIGEQQITNRLIESFGNIIKKYIVGSFPIGVSLTGGLDSRMIMSCLNEEHGKFPCYTFGSMYRDTLDVQIAQKVAKACGQPHHKLILGEEFLSNFPKYLEKAVFISDGYLGMSGAAELYLNSLARQIAPVRFTGNYGGELFRGVRTFKFEFPKGEFVNIEILPFLNEAQKTFEEFEESDPITFSLFHQAPSQGYGRLIIEKSQVILRTPFMDNDLVKLLYLMPSNILKTKQLTISIILKYNPKLLDIPTDQGFLYNDLWLKSKIRQYYRKFFIKGEYLSNYGMPNWIPSHYFYGFDSILKKIFFGRNKFDHFRYWSQKNFREYIKDVIFEGIEDLKEFLNSNKVKEILNRHILEGKNYVEEIDKVITLILSNKLIIKNHCCSNIHAQGGHHEE